MDCSRTHRFARRMRLIFTIAIIDGPHSSYHQLLLVQARPPRLPLKKVSEEN